VRAGAQARTGAICNVHAIRPQAAGDGPCGARREQGALLLRQRLTREDEGVPVLEDLGEPAVALEAQLHEAQRLLPLLQPPHQQRHARVKVRGQLAGHPAEAQPHVCAGAVALRATPGGVMLASMAAVPRGQGWPLHQPSRLAGRQAAVDTVPCACAGLARAPPPPPPPPPRVCTPPWQGVWQGRARRGRRASWLPSLPCHASWRRKTSPPLRPRPPVEGGGCTAEQQQLSSRAGWGRGWVGHAGSGPAIQVRLKRTWAPVLGPCLGSASCTACAPPARGSKEEKLSPPGSAT
jgi:hypothetical protein